jgi:hypothetical protein
MGDGCGWFALGVIKHLIIQRFVLVHQGCERYNCSEISNSLKLDKFPKQILFIIHNLVIEYICFSGFPAGLPKLDFSHSLRSSVNCEISVALEVVCRLAAKSQQKMISQCHTFLDGFFHQ